MHSSKSIAIFSVVSDTGMFNLSRENIRTRRGRNPIWVVNNYEMRCWFLDSFQMITDDWRVDAVLEIAEKTILN